MRLLIYHLNQDDPKKCTARKMERFGLARIVKYAKRIPKNSIILDPLAEQILSFKDRDIFLKYGMVAIDCSWQDVEYVFSKFVNFKNRRRLPFLIPVNPVNYGKPEKLSTLEAFIASLYIMKEDKMVERLSRLYKWSFHFVTMNKELLEIYRNSKDAEDIKRKLEEFF